MNCDDMVDQKPVGATPSHRKKCAGPGVVAPDALPPGNRRYIGTSTAIAEQFNPCGITKEMITTMVGLPPIPPASLFCATGMTRLTFHPALSSCSKNQEVCCPEIHGTHVSNKRTIIAPNDEIKLPRIVATYFVTVFRPPWSYSIARRSDQRLVLTS
jgi:hypothetical protein